jgi:hypothetical protein
MKLNDILTPLGVARADSLRVGITMPIRAQDDFDARATEMLARLEAFNAEVSALVPPINARMKADLARRYRELQAEFERINFLGTSRN